MPVVSSSFADFYAKETLSATVVQLPFTSVQSQISIDLKVISVNNIPVVNLLSDGYVPCQFVDQKKWL
jgi:hypothetical protein